MRTLICNSTADQLLDYLASDGVGGWTYLAELGDWEILYNLRNESRFMSRLAQNLVDRGLAETRRAARGLQVRLTPDGIALAGQCEQTARTC